MKYPIFSALSIAAITLSSFMAKAQSHNFTSVGTVIVDGNLCDFSADAVAAYHIENGNQIIDNVNYHVVFDCMPGAFADVDAIVTMAADGSVDALNIMNCTGGPACTKVVNVGNTVVDDLNGLIR